MIRAVIWCAVSDPQQAYQGKESLPSQEREGLTAAEQLGLDVVAVLKVPGFSRDYLDIFSCANDMAAAGHTAMRDLLTLMERRGFDVLICRDADRFGRTQWLISYIVEYVIREMGSRIYATSKKLWVDAGNFRMWAAMAGFAAASELDTFRARRSIGITARIKRGLHPSIPPLSHHYIRDEKGKPVSMVLDPRRERLLTDLATLLLDEHTAYDELSLVLNRRFGHVNDKGKPWSDSTFEKLLYNPCFWGHAVEGWQTAGRKGHTGKLQRWVYDQGTPPPGVEVWRDTHPAAYTGIVALRIQAELTRRENIYGHASPRSAYAYSGLIRCGWCGFAMSGYTRKYTRNGVLRGKYIYYRCPTPYRASRSVNGFNAPNGILPTCKYNNIDEVMLHQAIRKFLDRVLADETVLVNSATKSKRNQAAAIDQEITDLETQLVAIIDEQASRKGTARDLYVRKIDTMGERLDILKNARLHALATLHSEESINQARTQALAEVRTLTVDGVMVLAANDPARYHQILAMIINSITIQDGDIQIIL